MVMFDCLKELTLHEEVAQKGYKPRAIFDSLLVLSF